MSETIAETVAAATEVVTEATEYVVPVVTEVMITADQYATLVEYLNYLTSFALFFVIVALCYFGYKFFRIFF